MSITEDVEQENRRSIHIKKHIPEVYELLDHVKEMDDDDNSSYAREMFSPHTGSQKSIDDLE